MRKLILFVLLFLLLAGCAQAPAPGAYYLIPAGGTITPDFQHCEGNECWYVQVLYPTGETLAPTTIPTLPPVKVCEIRAGSSAQYLRREHDSSAGIVGSIASGQTATGQQFWYSLTLVEWVQVSYKGVQGWVLVDNNITYDPLGPCLDVPAEYAKPIPPTATPAPPQPTPTPIGKIYACLGGGSYLNIRSGAGTTYPVVGTLTTQRLEIVTKLDNGWWEVLFNGRPGSYLAGWLARDC